MLKIFLMVLQAVADFLGLMKNKQQQDAGHDRARADTAEQALEDIARARDARDKARDANNAVPGGGDASQLPDDGFRRD